MLHGLIPISPVQSTTTPPPPQTDYVVLIMTFQPNTLPLAELYAGSDRLLRGHGSFLMSQSAFVQGYIARGMR